MPAVLVTGGHGFLGSYVVRDLAARGATVVILDVTSPSVALQKRLAPYGEQIEFVQGSITNRAWVKEVVQEHDVGQIVHAAALCDAEALLTQPYCAFEVNTLGTVNLLDAAQDLPGRFVHISSIAVYQSKRYEPLDEAHPIFDPRRGHPAGPYGASKAAAEMMGQSYAEEAGVDYIALRVAAIYGFGMNIPLYLKPLLTHALAGEPYTLEGGPGRKRNFTYVKDAVSAVCSALDAPGAQLRQRAFTIAEGRLYSPEEVADLVRKVIPGATIEVRPGTALSAEARRRMEHYGELDLSAAREQLGFEPRYPLEAGLRDYVEECRRME
ncbi:MAG: SDR family NAD(P)-dependent oxidoreductase [Ardenticatenaceae bacterium]|nr:SDR family NAD(P)-dependent oxidoreductase [Ardenticatenaceae bacterium]